MCPVLKLAGSTQLCMLLVDLIATPSSLESWTQREDAVRRKAHDLRTVPYENDSESKCPCVEKAHRAVCVKQWNRMWFGLDSEQQKLLLKPNEI